MAKTGSALVDLEVADGEGAAAAAPEGSAASPAPPGDAGAPAPTPASTPAPADPGADAGVGVGRGLATPAVRRIAREHRIEVSTLLGSGKAGRVTKEDILRVVEGGGGAPPAPAARGWGAPRSAPPAAPPPPLPSPSPRAAPPAPLGVDQAMPLRGLARTMSKSMAAAWAVPHFGFSDEVVVDALIAARGALAPIAAARSGGAARLTFLPFMIKAASIALGGAPGLNARVEAGGEVLLLRAAHNIGVAMEACHPHRSGSIMLCCQIQVRSAAHQCINNIDVAL